MIKKRALRWELSGVLVIFLAGSLLHFVFEWTNYWHPVAWIAPVNESVWEHFKLSFWPGLMFALVEYPFLKGVVTNFWVGKSLGLLLMPVVVGAGFYGYTAVLGDNYLWADILLFLVGVVVGQLVSYRVMTAGAVSKWIGVCAVVGLVVMVGVFSLFSYYPPRVFLFEDMARNQYGILEDYGE